MDMTEIERLIGSIGVPAAIAGFVLFKLNGTIESLNKTMNGIIVILARICEHLNIPSEKP